MLGAGLEIREPLSGDLLGHVVALQVQTASALTGALKDSRLAGVIRDVDSESKRGTRLGIQFVGDLPWSERALVEAYGRMRMTW